MPQNFRVERIIDARTGKFAWDPILEAQALDPVGGMKGKLAGFIIQFYKTSGNVQAQQVELKNHKVEGNVSETFIGNLPPYSTVKLSIAALNDRYQGPFSAPITIYTLEGVPGPVVNLRGIPYGSSGVRLEWEEPEEPNGVITGYEILFQQIST